MIDVPNDEKKLILGAAYLALRLHDWKCLALQSKNINPATKTFLVGKMPCGDAKHNLMQLAELLLPDFSRHTPMSAKIEKIKKFIGLK